MTVRDTMTVPDSMISPGTASAGTATLLDPTPPPVWVWTGDLDVADVEALSSAWQSLLGDHPASVVIDLSGVTFLDCAVLSVLVRADDDPRTRLLLQAVPACVDRLLQLTGLSTRFTRTATPGRARTLPAC